jgi:hypothetical protein
MFGHIEVHYTSTMVNQDNQHKQPPYGTAIEWLGGFLQPFGRLPSSSSVSIKPFNQNKFHFIRSRQQHANGALPRSTTRIAARYKMAAACFSYPPAINTTDSSPEPGAHFAGLP